MPAWKIKVSRAYKKAAKPTAFLADLWSLAPLAGNIVSFFLAIPLTIGVAVPSAPVVQFNPAQLSLPFRLLCAVGCAALLGWGLGAFIAHMTKRNSEGRMVAIVVVAMVWGALLVALMDSFSVATANLPEFLVFLLLGMCIVLWLLTFKLKSSASPANQVIMQDRATVIFAFAGTATFAGLFVYLDASL